MDLFEAGHEEKRRQLRERGWEGTPDFSGECCWRRPDGASLSEDEAFTQLERLIKEEEAARGERP